MSATSVPSFLSSSNVPVYPSASSFPTLPTSSMPPMPFRVWSGNRKVKKSLVAKSCVDVVAKAAAKLGIPDGSKCRLVLEECGTEVDDDEYLRMLPSNCILMLLQADEKWCQLQLSPCGWTNNLMDDGSTFNFGLNAPTTLAGQSAVGAKRSQRTSPFLLGKRKSTKSHENSLSPSGSREGSLPLPSPSAFAAHKLFSADSVPTVFSIHNSAFPFATPSTPSNSAILNAGTAVVTLPAGPGHHPINSSSSPQNFENGTSMQVPQQMQNQVQQQQNQMLQPQQRLAALTGSPSSRVEEFPMTSTGEGGVSPTGVSSNVIISNGISSSGAGLTPILLSGGSLGSGVGSVVIGETLPNPETGSDACPIYALGPHGPFFVAAAAAGSGSSVTPKVEMGAGAPAATSGGGYVIGGVVIGGGGGGSGVVEGGGAVGASDSGAMIGSGPFAKDEMGMVGESGKTEIVGPPSIADSEELQKIQKATRERFKRKSKDLPCTVAGCLKKFRDEYDRKTHMRCHTGERPFKCFSCDKRFAHMSSRIHHHKTVHLNKREFICSVCGKSFVKKVEAQRHQWTSHGIPSAPSQRSEGCLKDRDSQIVDSTTTSEVQIHADKIT